MNLVSSEELFDFLIKQADKLGASDIHIENERDSIRVRMRVDGALHPVAQLERSRYLMFNGSMYNVERFYLPSGCFIFGYSDRKSVV